MMPRHLRRSCLASVALLAASLVLGCSVTWQYMVLQERQNAWIDYRQQLQQQRARPVWLSAQDQAQLKLLAQHDALQVVDAEAVKNELARWSSPQYELRNEQVAKPEPVAKPQGHWRLYAIPVEFEAWLQHEEAFSEVWARFNAMPGWLELVSCHLGRDSEASHPVGIVLHCTAKLLGFGPEYGHEVTR